MSVRNENDGEAKPIRGGAISLLLEGLFGLDAVTDISNQGMAGSDRNELEKKTGYKVGQVTYQEWQDRQRSHELSTKVVKYGQGNGKKYTSGWLDKNSPIAYAERALFSFMGCVIDSRGGINLFHFDHVSRETILKELQLKGRKIVGGIVGSQQEQMKEERFNVIHKANKSEIIKQGESNDHVFVDTLGLQPIYSPERIGRIDLLVDPSQREILYTITNDSEAAFFQSI